MCSSSLSYEFSLNVMLGGCVMRWNWIIIIVFIFVILIVITSERIVAHNSE